MNRSKLEFYEDIMQALAKRPLSIERIAFTCNMDCVNLRQRINFLIKNDIVQERMYGKKPLYALTARGLAIFNTLNLTHQLEKLQTTADEFDQKITVPSFSEIKEQKKKKSEKY